LIGPLRVTTGGIVRFPKISDGGVYRLVVCGLGGGGGRGGCTGGVGVRGGGRAG